VHLEGENPGVHAGIVVHDRDGFVDASGEYADAADIGIIGNWQHNRQHAVAAEPEIAPACSQMIAGAVSSAKFGPCLRMTTLYALAVGNKAFISSSVKFFIGSP
jgi:hypothetical protein